MPAGFGFPRNQQLWVPLPVQDAPPREGPPVQVFGRLADGASWQAAAAELELVTTRASPRSTRRHACAAATRVRAFAGRTPGDPLQWEELLIHAIVLLVLGAVCANVATLVFARTAMRESEIVVRSALGASRARVVTQIVTESLVLALAAAGVGLLTAQAIVRYAGTRTDLGIDGGLPFWVDLTLEPMTVAYALLLALIATVLIGALPALKATGSAVQQGLQGMTGAGTDDPVRRSLVVHHRRAGRVHPDLPARRRRDVPRARARPGRRIGVPRRALPDLPPEHGRRGAPRRGGRTRRRGRSARAAPRRGTSSRAGCGRSPG
jgi:putative ABC transport system permease protein